MDDYQNPLMGVGMILPAQLLGCLTKIQAD